MTRALPEAGCYELAFQAGYPMDEPSEVALEDYARTLTQAREAEAMRMSEESSRISGVHLCGLGAIMTEAALSDIEDFARDLATHAGGSGLGWG